MTLMEKQFFYFEKLDKNGSIWAKPDGTSLQRHSYDVAFVAQKLVEDIFINKKYQKCEEGLKKLIVFSAYVHDVGKADERWQEYIKEKIKKGEKSPIPHPLFSLPFAKWFLEKNLNGEFENEDIKNFFISTSLVAIATHHSPFTNEKYEEYKDWQVNYRIPLLSDLSIKPYPIFDNARNELWSQKLRMPWKDRRYFYVLINGIISLADWIVSGNVEYKTLDIRSKQDFINSYFLRNGWSFTNYQEKVKRYKSNNVLIPLPTGTGKTETALLWYSTIPQGKLLYTLPTVTTVDAMRSRLEKIFGKNNVSFAHHLLKLSLEEERLTKEELFIQEHLLRPIGVTTVDHVLLSLMNWRRYQVNEVMLNNSILIIDEIHSYSPFTFSLIIEALRYLMEYHGTKVCIMSATLPKFIQDCLNHKGLDNSAQVFSSLLSTSEVEKEYRWKKRTKIEKFYEGETIGDRIMGYIEELSPNKTLIVANTVTRAQTIYEKLVDWKKEKGRCEEILLFHSRFIYKDRLEKFQKLNEIENSQDQKKCILVATQIVEVSLDIDYDILFTEIAPLDAIVQRAGRINRKGKKDVGKIYIFDVADSEKGFLPYTKEQIKIARNVIRDTEIKSEMDYLVLNESYYEGIKDSIDKELREKKLEEFLEQLYEKRDIDKVITTRDGFLTIPVVPIKFYNEVKEIENKIENLKKLLSKEEDEKKIKELKNKILNYSTEKLKYYVQITFYNVKNNVIEDQFVDLEYDSEYGVRGKNVRRAGEAHII